ncbi:tRNA ligase [Saccharomycopsis crataegensis]|uniref:tRNA ligase n=1 Tax=Saccharomycopsis crataegensis TaxID=43959 RepID=A0AAV5QIE7_9ASCO|nr:tRNA ligase [Saccharomycopsis crataegensis]
MIDISEFQSYAQQHGSSSVDLDGFVDSLEKSLNVNNKKGKGSKSVLTTFNKPDLPLASWKFKEWDYLNPEINLPSNARGLFTTENSPHKIVVRGYNKFFNVNEAKETKVDAIKNNSQGPYEVTLKSNGCIIFISGLEDGTLVVCSKHSTGIIDNYRNHSLQGKEFLERQLKELGVDSKEFGKALNELNVTAIAEYCDDDFEEHVLQYVGDDIGLYLHGLNFNIPEFKTFPMDLVTKFAVKFGFKTTSYFVESDVNKLFEFLEKSAKTGMYEGEEVEGFVIRCKEKSTDSDFFWKFKFEEPYLMYRQWREATKKLIKVRDLNDPSFKKYNDVTRHYLEFVAPIINNHEKLGKYYLLGHSIIDLRKLYLKFIGKEGYELTKSKAVDHEKAQNIKEIISSRTMTQKEVEDDIEGIIKGLSHVQIDEKQVQAQMPAPLTDPKVDGCGYEILQINKYCLIPIATIGCGKTTTALTLLNLFPQWGHIQNDNLIKNKVFNKRLERKSLEFLMGNTAVLDEDKLNVEIDEFLKNPKKFGSNPYSMVKEKNKTENKDKILDSNNVIIVDRNNHMFRERKDLFSYLRSLKTSYLTNDGELVTDASGKVVRIRYQLKFICLNFLPKKYFPYANVSADDRLWNVTHGRIKDRGDNHQTIKLNSEKDLADVEKIMKGFIGRFQFCDPKKSPDSSFDSVIDLNIFEDNSSRVNAEKILKQLYGEFPEVLNGKMPTKEEIDEAFKKALDYKPKINKIVRGSGKKSEDKQKKNHKDKNENNSNPKPRSPKINYFGIEISDPSTLLSRVYSLINKKQNILNLEPTQNFFHKLAYSQRIQPRFHVTLVHAAHKDKSIFKGYSQLLESCLSSTTNNATANKAIVPVGKICFDIKLDKLVWDGKAAAILVKIVGVHNVPEDKKDTIKYGNSRLHITLGTENVSIKPFYSNTMLEYADEYITKDASGIYEDNICVFQWDDDDSDAYLNKLPLTGFIQ